LAVSALHNLRKASGIATHAKPRRQGKGLFAVGREEQVGTGQMEEIDLESVCHSYLYRIYSIALFLCISFLFSKI